MGILWKERREKEGKGESLNLAGKRPEGEQGHTRRPAGPSRLVKEGTGKGGELKLMEKEAQKKGSKITLEKKTLQRGGELMVRSPGKTGNVT